MDMHKRVTFHDVPGNIHLENGIVHIDFYDKTPAQDEQDTPQYCFSERLVLSLPAFLQLHDLMCQVVNRLENEGYVHRTTEQAR